MRDQRQPILARVSLTFPRPQASLSLSFFLLSLSKEHSPVILYNFPFLFHFVFLRLFHYIDKEDDRFYDCATVQLRNQPNNEIKRGFVSGDQSVGLPRGCA